MTSKARRVHLRDELLERAPDLAAYVLTVVSAPGGAGKTTLARAWRDRLREEDRPCAWLSVVDAHDDYHFFLSDLIGAIAEAVQEAKARPATCDEAACFGESIQRLMQLCSKLDERQILRRLTIELRALGVQPTLILDAFESLGNDSAPARLVDGLLRLDRCPLRIVLTTRGLEPSATARLLAAGDAQRIQAGALDLRAAQVADILNDHGVEPTPELIAGLLARTRGWAIAVQVMAQALGATPADRRLDRVRELSSHPDLFAYIGGELLRGISPDALEVLETAARLGAAPAATLITACDPTIDGPKGLIEAREAGLLLEDAGVLSLHDLWREWLVSPLRTSGNGDSEATRRLRLARALVESEPERAVDQLREALPNEDAQNELTCLLEEHGQDWLGQGQRGRVERALAEIDEETIASRPRLSALEGLFILGSDPERAIEYYERACAAYREAGDVQAEGVCLHELGVLAINENRIDVVRRVRSRTMALARHEMQGSRRGFVLIALGFAAMMARRPKAALRILDSARTYQHHPRELGGIALVQAEILFAQGRFGELLRRVDAVLARPEQRLHASSFAVLQVLKATVEGNLGLDPEGQRERLEEASELFARFHYSLNRIRAESALAHHSMLHGEAHVATEHLEIAEALARRIELGDAAAAALGGQARVSWLADDRDKALELARAALQLLAQPESWCPSRGFAHAFVPGVMVACLVLLQAGKEADVEAVAAFLAKHTKRLRWPELPLVEHSVKLVHARLAVIQEDRSRATRSIRAAWDVAERARLEGFASEFDRDLLRALAIEAFEAGVEGEALSLALDQTGGPPTTQIQLKTLGGIELVLKGGRVPDRAWHGLTAKRLLARLLANEGRPVTRERLQADLWPEASPSKARTNLRAALLRLRDALEPRRRRVGSEPARLVVEGEHVSLDRELVEAWDVYRIDTLLSRAERGLTSNLPTIWTNACDELERIQTGEFATEVNDAWVVPIRSAIERRHADRIRALAEGLLERGQPARALRMIEGLLAQEPVDERAWALAIRARIAAGDPHAVQQALHDARSRLDRVSSEALEKLVVGL